VQLIELLENDLQENKENDTQTVPHPADFIPHRFLYGQ
jgi:hypothetical protein